MIEACSWVLSFARADASKDPYAFRLGRQRYILVSAGGGTQEAELDWDEALLADLVAIRQPQRNPDVMQRLGEKLRQFLSNAGWPQHEASILAAVQARRRVVLILRSAAAEIYALPWELITLKSSGQHVGELPGVLLAYEWPDTQSAPAAFPLSSPVRILLAWSAAGGAVPAAEHVAALRQAEQRDGPAVSITVLPHASLRSLAEALAAAQREGRPITVLHLLCHGFAMGSAYALAWNGDDAERPAAIDAGVLRRLLSPFAAMVRLVVLSACDSGNAGAPGNHLGSVAQALHRIGIPKVVASRYPLSVPGSIRLAEVLYRELVGGASIEDALLALRQELFRDSAHLDWVSLQLYARAADGALRTGDLFARGSRPQISAAPLAEQAPAPERSRSRRLIVALTALLLAGGSAAAVKLRRAAAPRAVMPPPTQNSVIAAPPIAPSQGVPSPVLPSKKPSGPARLQVEQKALFTVRIRSDSGNFIRVAGSRQTALPTRQGNQAEAAFRLGAGVHRVTCTDAVTKKSIDVVLHVGPEERNETDCFPP